MKEGWSNHWKKLLIWISGYLSIVAFAIVGGYAIVKSNDEELKKTAKKAFIVTVIFTIIAAFLAVYSACMSIADTVSAGARDAFTWITSLSIIVEVIVYAVFAIIDFCKKDKKVEVIEEKEDKVD